MFFANNGIKPEINNRQLQKSPNIWKFNNTFLNNLWVKVEVTREIRKCFELNENVNAKYVNMWDADEAMFT